MDKNFLNINNITNEHISKIQVVCTGHFNVLHPGHFRFLKFLRSLGGGVCVVLQEINEVYTGNEQNYFSEEDRSTALLSLTYVDFVLASSGTTIEGILRLLKPEKFVLGHEFERHQPNYLKAAIETAKNIDIDVVFHSGDQVNYFDDLLSLEPRLPSLQQKLIRSFNSVCKRRSLSLIDLKHNKKAYESISTLVVGDFMVDEFVSSEPLGLSSEAPVIVVKELEKKQYIGGAGIVAAHVASLTGVCQFLSVVGSDEPAKFASAKLASYGVDANLIVDKARPTTFKTRYLSGTQKLFRVSRLIEKDVSPEIERLIIQKVEELAPGLDNIIVSDFVYGVVTDKVLNAIQKVARQHNILLFGDLQCSSQVGNVLRFERFATIFPTEKEARIAINNKDDGLEFVARSLFERSNCDSLIIKLGSDGLIAYKKTPSGFIQSEHFPALSGDPVDVSGAGDTLLASVATAVTSGRSIMEAVAAGTVAASVAVETLGNYPVSIEQINAKIDWLRDLKSQNAV